MAKHFKEAPAEATEQMDESSMTQRRRFGSHSRQNTTSLPYGQAATYHYSYPTAVPTQDFYTDGVEARGGIRRLGRGLLLLCAWAFRACALCLVLLVILNVFQFHNLILRLKQEMQGKDCKMEELASRIEQAGQKIEAVNNQMMARKEEMATR